VSRASFPLDVRRCSIRRLRSGTNRPENTSIRTFFHRPYLSVGRAGFAAVVFFLASVAQFWHPVFRFTSFLTLASSNDDTKIDAFKRQPVYVYGNGGYDGLYYAQLAYHPTLTSPELARAMDVPAYRARRILVPALAYLLALGRPAWILHVYSILNVLAWLALAALLWRLLPVCSWRSWVAWAGVLFSSGAASSVRLALTDLVALTILAAALACAERSQRGLAAAVVAAAGLARETSLLAIAAIVQRPWASWRNAARIAIAIAPLVTWLAYIRWVFGGNDAGWGNFGPPLGGLAEKIVADTTTVRAHANSWLAWTTMFATAGLIAQAAFFAVRPRFDDAWWRLGAAYALMMTALGTPVWEGFPGAATRVLLPMALAFNVVAARNRARWVWLLAGNLTVLNGFLVLQDVPHEPHELAAGHAGGTAIVARTSDEWYGVEWESRHALAWSPWRGQLDLETWPRVTRAIDLEASVRSRELIVLTVRQDQAVLWRNAVFPGFPRPMKLAVSCSVRDGRARLEFQAAPLGQLDAPEGLDRSPIFAVGDMRFAAAERVIPLIPPRPLTRNLGGPLRR
jgi:hypothetical protein